MTYETSEPSQYIYHQASRLQPQGFSEINGSAEDATVYLGMSYVSIICYLRQQALTVSRCPFPG
jgi:hypothetical protein